MIETASKVAVLTRRQYNEWRENEKLEAKKENGRGRSLSKRRKRGTENQAKREASQKRVDKERAEAEENGGRKERK